MCRFKKYTNDFILQIWLNSLNSAMSSFPNGSYSALLFWASPATFIGLGWEHSKEKCRIAIQWHLNISLCIAIFILFLRTEFSESLGESRGCWRKSFLWFFSFGFVFCPVDSVVVVAVGTRNNNYIFFPLGLLGGLVR